MPVIESESHTCQYLLRIRSPSIFRPSVNSYRRVLPLPRALHLHLLPGGIFRGCPNTVSAFIDGWTNVPNIGFTSRKKFYRYSKDLLVTQKNVFTHLPFQAAGNFRNGKPHEIMVNRAASSYISSFRMLKWTRSRSSKSSKSELVSTIGSLN